MIAEQCSRAESQIQESRNDLSNLKSFSSGLGRSLSTKNLQKQELDLRISTLASLKCFESSQSHLEASLNQLLKKKEIPRGISRALCSFLENRELLPNVFPQETMNALMRLGKESLEERLLSLRKEMSEEEFKEVVGLLHLLSTGTGQDSLSQVAGLLLGHLEAELESEKQQLESRVRNLGTYVQSFDAMDDSGYTVLFMDTILNGLGVFFSVLELERGLKVFSKQGGPNKTRLPRALPDKSGPTWPNLPRLSWPSPIRSSKSTT